ncbi:cell division protein ZipA [Acinetobacter marinus]|uniref:Cell division protein ZipA n=1 Tax=Acinetobacter marinus TaxID=281375 RepID=A0A1G6MPZ0_9GAMM|nr:cell division protein ZipA C-terminal FtsZ-binding domain-containing protein [Acinetobacter marinus]SDC57297.1 cell division protein ZipA [Acinetobacter marinus]
MDQLWEIVGIIVAVVMVIIGFRLIIKKPKAMENQEPAEVMIEAQSQQPITPRHLRDEHRDANDAEQLQHAAKKEQLEQTFEQQPSSTETAPRVEPVAQTASKPVVEPDQTEVASKSTTPDQADEIERFIEQLDQDSDPSLDQNSDQNSDQKNVVKDQQNADIQNPQSADTQVESKSHATDDNATTATVAETETETALETVEIEEWQGESDVLDAHLSEQYRNDEESALAKAEQLIALYLYPNPTRALSGDRALKTLLKYGLRFGEMSCFHRYENPETVSPLMFSVLRINDDGAPTGFDLETLPNEEVKGLAFFLALPNAQAVQGFDMMVSLAGLMARDIDGLVFDEQSLELTPQLRDHWRHYVIEYKAPTA